MVNRLKDPIPVKDLHTDKGAIFEFNEECTENPEDVDIRLEELLQKDEGGVEPGAHPKRLAEDKASNGAAGDAPNIRGLRDSEENERILRAFSSDLEKSFSDAEFRRRMDECGTFMQNDDEEADADGEDELSIFEKKKRFMHDITNRFSADHTGLIYKRTVKTGVGQTIPDGAFVIFDYKMFYEEKLEPFDATRLRNRVERQRVGSGALIEGMELALLSMQKGEEAEFLVVPELMFGKQGVHPRIPAEAVIFMQIEVHSFSERGSIEEYYDMTEEERRELPFSRVIKVAEDVRRDGNLFFEDRRYAVAAKKYYRAEQLLCGANARTKEDDLLRESKLLKVYLNQALIWLKSNDNQTCIKYCNYALNSLDKLVREKALTIEEAEARCKCHYRKGLALGNLKKFDEAEAALHVAHRILPSNQDVQRALRNNDKRKLAALADEKMLYSRMIPGFKKLDTTTNTIINNKDNANKTLQVVTVELQTLLKEFAANQKLRTFAPPVSVSGWTKDEVEELVSFVKSLSLVPLVKKNSIVEIVKN